MSEKTVQPNGRECLRLGRVRQIGIAAKDVAKKLFLIRQDVLSEGRMGAKPVEDGEKKNVSPFAKLVLAGVLAAGCTENVTNNYYYGEQDTDSASDIDADTDTDVDADTDSDTDSDVDADTDSDVDSDVDADTDSDVDTEEECVEEIAEPVVNVANVTVYDYIDYMEYLERIWADMETAGNGGFEDMPVDGYPLGAFTIVHEFDGAGIPEYTNSNALPLDRSDRHNLAIVFNTEFWELAEFDPGMEKVKLGKQAVMGVVSIGEYIELPNGYKLGLWDISYTVNENGERDAIMRLLDTEDNEVGVLSMTPGRVLNVMEGQGQSDPIFVKVNMTAPGVNFIAKFAQVMAYDEVNFLYSGKVLSGGERVAVAIQETDSGIKTLKEIKIYRPVNGCD